MRTAEPGLRRLIDVAANHFKIPDILIPATFQNSARRITPGTLLEALILTESSGNPLATRYEPHQDRGGAVDQDGARVDDGMMEDDKSYGLMQIMGYNIKAILGIPASAKINFQFALSPMLNIHLGCTLLAMEMRAVTKEFNGGSPEPYYLMTRALARYNGGPSGDNPDANYPSKMRCQGYVDKVITNAIIVSSNRLNSHWRDLVGLG